MANRKEADWRNEGGLLKKKKILSLGRHVAAWTKLTADLRGGGGDISSTVFLQRKDQSEGRTDHSAERIPYENGW